ncbi:FUSC family protein [Pseudidiomarina sp.]|uniref:FUSC family protein n=1 Tax=Pseudidiomarina sp. TaxID=2081707 RepID=UPI00299DA9B0|nr:FUSC family protein [Pseudidiomarina sp.]MDX1706693.1 FUSC family protein [Pseudidiomarina sp.]
MSDAAETPGLLRRVYEDIKILLSFQPTDRPWHFPVVTCFAAGIPVALGALSGQLRLAVLSSIGGLVIMYLPPQARTARRMVTLIVCLFGFLVSFTLASLASFYMWSSALAVGVIAMLANNLCRRYQVPPPGRFFFIMIAALASTLPFDLMMIPSQIGWLALGGMISCLLAFIYSLLVPVRTEGLNKPKQPAPPKRNREYLRTESSVIGVFVGGSYLIAMLMGLNNPYWVPISCLAIMQGVNIRQVRHRQIHRIVGTALGMVFAWFMLNLEIGPWMLVLLVTGLTFIIESIVMRNYGLAMIFITPLTVLLADAAFARLPPDELIMTRLVDITLGSVIGFVGGWWLYRQLERNHGSIPRQ